jgi:hypothetical protein
MTDPRYPGPGQPYGGQSPYGGGAYGAPEPYGTPDPYRQQDPYGQPAPYGNAPRDNPYGGQPQDPYGGQPHDPYGAPPQDPYGQPAPYSASPYSGGPYGGGSYGGAQQNPYGPPSPYGSPSPYPAPPAKGGSGKVIAAVIAVVAVLAVAGIGGLLLLSNKSKHNNPVIAGASGSTRSGQSGTSQAAPTHAPTSAAPTVKNTDSVYAKVGDCLAGQTMDSTTAQEVSDVSIVACTSSDAKYKVVGIVANKTEAQFNADDNICGAYPTAVSALWQGRSGGTGKVLCLADAKKK